ncbi:hypothetical protein Leryth_018359 [Lithospermum erythrorhizon]|nr:hypothetical protein Leryth_018359 [Lithospermum erythrorhizon]
MVIKASLDPENKHLSSWNIEGDPCSGAFEGVACNEHRKVSNITLQGKGLTGTLSAAISELKCLSGLYLHYNSLSGELPEEIGNLTELTDLYLNVNNLSGSIPPHLGSMTSLQVLQLCCNKLTGRIPPELGFLKKLIILAVQNNRLSGPIPPRLANSPQLEVLEVQNNSLSGIVPPGLKRLKGGFHFENNPDLCGVGISSLRVCTAWDNLNINQIDPFPQAVNNKTATSISIHRFENASTHCCEGPSRSRLIGIIAGSVSVVVTLMVAVFITVFRYRRRKQKVSNLSEAFDDRSSMDAMKEFQGRSPSPLVTLEYSNRWNQVVSEDNFGSVPELLQGSKRFNLEDVESATQHFSEVNLLGKSKFSAVYKGILKDGLIVAIKSISVTSCKTDEAEFMKGLKLLTSLKHENLVDLKGFCHSKGRGECFLVYNFAPKGNLSQYLDIDDTSKSVLDWSTRISIIAGIAKGLGYLHISEENKPPIVHHNISVEKILLDEKFTPLISDCGLLKLLADDVVYSALKVSAALGYMAPEYITTGKFTEKSDVYAFGVIIFQILSGKTMLSHTTRLAAESGNFNGCIDLNLKGNFNESEARKLAESALLCTNENPESRPTMASVIEDLSILGGR